MKDKKSLLFSDYTLPPPPAEGRQKAVAAALAAARQVPRSQSLAGQMWVQLSHVGVWFWLGALALLGLELWLLGFIRDTASSAADSFFPTLALFGATGPLAACLATPVLARSHTHNMWELEEAAFHNLPRLAALRLTICALAALPVLALVALAGLGATGMLPGLVSLIAPFLLASGLNYFILGRLRGYAGSLLCLGSCLVLALVAALPITLPLHVQAVFRGDRKSVV